MSKHVGENCGKLCISYILSSKRGITPSKIDAKGWHSNLICSTVKQSHMQNVTSIHLYVREKCGKLHISYILSFTKRHNSFKNWCKVTTLELDLLYIKTKSCAKFQLNMAKHVGETGGRRVRRTDGDPAGHHHTIIRPVWRRAYNTNVR